METASRVILTFLLNSLWQVALLALVAAACAQLMRRTPARHRHLLWAVALALALLLPLLTVAGANVFDLFKPSQNPIAAGGATGKDSISASFNWIESLFQNNSRSISFAPSLASVLACCYLAFLLYRAVRLGRAWRRTRLICRDAGTARLSPLLDSVINNCRAALKLNAVPVLSSHDLAAPITAGARRSVIILPETLLGSRSEELLTSAIAHEMAHIRRRDFLWNLVYELLYLPFSFHPAAWFIRRQLIRTREMACDEAVTAHVVESRDYARSLVRIAGSLSSLESPAYTLGIFDDNDLEERIMKILEKRPRASVRLARASLAIAALALLFSSIAASAFSLSIGQENNSQTSSLVGKWQLFPSNDAHPNDPPGPGITIIFATDGKKLTGKALVEMMINNGGATEKKYAEWVLMDPQFDGTNLSFKVSPPDKNGSGSASDYIEAKLKLAGNEFTGRWESSNEQSGDLRMARKKD